MENLDGFIASVWRLRAPYAALEGANSEWHIYSARFLSETSCDETSAIATGHVQEVYTASGTVCSTMPMLCAAFGIHAPRNAFVGVPGMELYTGISSAWRGEPAATCDSTDAAAVAAGACACG